MIALMINKPGLAVPTFVKQWRDFRRMSQEALAAAAGFQAPGISQLENGKQGFTDKSLAALANALNCTPVQLLAHDPSKPDSFWPLFDAAEKLTGAERRRAYGIIRAALSVLEAE